MPTTLVVTSINAPNTALRGLAKGCTKNGWDFIVAGDSKSPADFAIDGCRFLSLDAQRQSGFNLAKLCPERSYTRKNIAYLEAIRSGATVIVETDDDNLPLDEFWYPRETLVSCKKVTADRWVNTYRYFTPDFIYPRGLPLTHARAGVPKLGGFERIECPVQQGLADNDPDVDAVYRMLFPLPFHFSIDEGPIHLSEGSWCPFNSQNTTFFASVFPLLYLPAHCSFRMTDIWRSFVVQRILHARGLGVLFHRPTVWQERNEHDLHRDFTDEIPGYVHNNRIREELINLSLKPDASLQSMIELCYEALIRNGWVGAEEENLLSAWFTDLQNLSIH